MQHMGKAMQHGFKPQLPSYEVCNLEQVSLLL